MAEAANQPLNPRIQNLLESLRRRIRIYVWAEGVALGLIWLALTFWFGFSIDYLPVLAGANELSAPVRAGLLLIVAVTLGWILYRWILRRTFVRLSDRNMAIIIERHFEQFGDSLVTAVEMGTTDSPEESLHDDMLQHTGDEAIGQLDAVHLSQVFNKKSLLRNFLFAFLLLSPAAVMSFTHGDMVSLLMRRMYLLASERWPRQSDIQVVGVEITRTFPLPESLNLPTVMTFDENRAIRIGRGTDVRLIVHADKNKRIPKTCTIYYQSADQVSGRRNMQRQGSGDQQNQLFIFEEKPLKSILNTLEFEIVGFDDREGPYTIEVVDNPAVIDTRLSYQRPVYTGLPAVDQQPWVKGASVPFGTKLAVQFQTNKPLREALIENLINDEQSMIYYGQLALAGGDKTLPVSITVLTSREDPASRPSSESVQLALPGDSAVADWKLVDNKLHVAAASSGTFTPQALPCPARYLDANDKWVDCIVGQVDEFGQGFTLYVDQMFNELSLDISLIDSDGLPSERPHRVTIGASLDQDPTVDIVLRGIGTSVTPDVVIPVEGKVSDDYGVDLNWFDLLLDEKDPFEFPFQLVDGEKIDSRLDLREQRNKNTELELNPGDRMTLTVRSSDFFNLDGSPNVGSSSQYTLDVVTPDQLLSVLERRELALRQRFELIFDEMIALRDSLDRVAKDANGGTNSEAGREPEDVEPEDEDSQLTPEEITQRARTLRLLRAQRAQVQARKSAQETLGVALAFEDIRAELINNRVDTENRKNRLQQEISEPLQSIANDGFPELNDTLVELEKLIVEQQSDGQLATLALEQTDQLLAQMQLVLDKMLELETYNELIDLVRALIAEQQAVNEKTRKEQKKRALDLLE